MTFRTNSVDASRIKIQNRAPLNRQGSYVLYWMVSSRRTKWNFALQYAVEVARKLDAGVIVLEPLACDLPYASERFHRFILEGMSDNDKALNDSPVFYFPWVETAPGQEIKLLKALAQKACLIVSDMVPTGPLKKRIEKAAEKLAVSVHTIDGNGLLPLQLIDKDYQTAYSFRRFLHKSLPAFLDQRPLTDPLTGDKLTAVSPSESLLRAWPVLNPAIFLYGSELQSLPIDHQIGPVDQTGGSQAATKQLNAFLKNDLADYAAHRNIPDLDATSRLSPYLHCGHISVHQIFTALAAYENWSGLKIGQKPTGKRHGWWGLSESAEAFLDEVITWRELAYGCSFRDNKSLTYAGLPLWAQATLEQHLADIRPNIYDGDQLLHARTHDPLWNAAQRQLLREGRIHGYLRMLWGKKILEWNPSPQQALTTMIELNDRYALDGRNPNSYSGISWCLGKFDRAWGPERPIFGKVRYMSSQNTARKVAVRDYLRCYAEDA